MDLTKSDRSTLKGYFAPQAQPTASQFADLIESVLNQHDDGFAKPAGEPLSIRADGDEGSQKKALNFYRSFSEAPAWTLSLNPRANANQPGTRAGWSIGDAKGYSRLFIDQNTGDVGLSTTDPGGYRLNVQGKALVGDYLYASAEGAGRLRVGAAWGIPGLFSGDDGDKSLMLGVPSGQKVYLGTNVSDAYVEGGTGNAYLKGSVGIGVLNPAGYKLSVQGNVNVQGDAQVSGNGAFGKLNAGQLGLGASAPRTHLHVQKDAGGALGPILTLMNAGGGGGAGAAIDFYGYDPGATAEPTARLQSVDDANYSSHFVFLTKVPGARANALAERMRITSGGDVHVSGRLTLESADVPTAAEKLRAVRGIVHPNGAVNQGNGYTVKKVGGGAYDVTFTPAFAGTPAVVATQIYPNDLSSGGGDTRDNAVIVGVSKDKVRVKTGDGAGNGSDRWFSFIAMGPR